MSYPAVKESGSNQSWKEFFISGIRIFFRFDADAFHRKQELHGIIDWIATHQHGIPHPWENPIISGKIAVPIHLFLERQLTTLPLSFMKIQLVTATLSCKKKK